MPKLNQKGIIITGLLLGLLFTGLVILSVWYFYSISNITHSTAQELQSQINTPSIDGNKKQLNESTTSSVETKDYTSKNLKISFKIPEKFIVEEKFNNITLSYDGKVINISSQGSFYNTTEEHINDLEKKNKSYFKEKVVHTGNKMYTFIKTTKIDSNDESKTRTTYFGVSNYQVVLIYSSDLGTEIQLEEIVNSIKFL